MVLNFLRVGIEFFMFIRLFRVWYRKNKRMNERKNIGRVEGILE